MNYSVEVCWRCIDMLHNICTKLALQFITQNCTHVVQCKIGPETFFTHIDLVNNSGRKLATHVITELFVPWIALVCSQQYNHDSVPTTIFASAPIKLFLPIQQLQPNLVIVFHECDQHFEHLAQVRTITGGNDRQNLGVYNVCPSQSVKFPQSSAQCVRRNLYVRERPVVIGKGVKIPQAPPTAIQSVWKAFIVPPVTIRFQHVVLQPNVHGHFGIKVTENIPQMPCSRVAALCRQWDSFSFRVVAPT